MSSWNISLSRNHYGIEHAHTPNHRLHSYLHFVQQPIGEELSGVTEGSTVLWNSQILLKNGSGFRAILSCTFLPTFAIPLKRVRLIFIILSSTVAFIYQRHR